MKFTTEIRAGRRAAADTFDRCGGSVRRGGSIRCFGTAVCEV